MPRLLAFFSLFILFSIPSCSPKPDTKQTFLFLGHTYDWQDENRLDPRLELLDYQAFDGVWLGGDILARTLQKRTNLNYLDQFFDLKNPNTHWARGNHDELESDNLQWIQQSTGRPDYYLDCKDQLCILVLNTNLVYHPLWGYPNERCEERKAQLDLIQTLKDTTLDTRHLVILHHHTFPILDTPLLAKRYNMVPPRYIMSCDTVQTYENAFYPIIQNLLTKDIQVYMIGGDFGTRAKYLEYKGQDGIIWLGAGINNTVDKRYVPDYVTNFTPDSVLIFEYTPDLQELNWKFVSLQALLKQQQGAAYHDLPAAVRELD